jgi:colanic acid/amylovoran biosynthesis glycosyltransferase
MQADGIRHVHAHWATHTAYMAYIIHRLTGISYSFTAHAHDIYIRKAMLCRKVHSAAFVATISDFNREELVRDCGESVRFKIHIVRCGVSPEYLEPLPRRAMSRERPFAILTVASLRDYKGYPYAIEASKLLKAQGQRFQWISLGGGPDRQLLEGLIAETDVNDVFCLKGPASENTVFEAMQNADVFVLPSVMLADRRMEGIPVALMESLAAGIPTVATNISGISELVEDGVTGRLVPERDPQALADAVSNLIAHPDKSTQLATAGRERVLNEFTASKNAARLITLFENVINP